MRSRPLLFRLGVALAGIATPGPAAEQPPTREIRLAEDGRLAYSADAQGNTVIDFSHAGYEGGGVAIPFVSAKFVVEPDGTHDRERIQAALDLVATMPLGTTVFAAPCC